MRDLQTLLNGKDALLLTADVSVFVATGFSGEGALVVTSSGTKRYFTDPRYAEAAVIEGCETVVVTRPLNEALAELDSTGARAVGFDAEHTHMADYLRFVTALPNAKFLDVSEELCALRSTKSKEELALIGQAAQINDSAYELLLHRVHEGMTENDLAAELEYLLRKGGGEGLAFETISAFGENASKPHAVPSQRKLRHGDLVTLDFGCKYHGYCSDITRTFAFGTPNAVQKHVYDCVLGANLQGIAAAKEGVNCADVDAAARKYLASFKLDTYFTHSTGHGVGAEIHESPKISASSQATLTRGTVFTVEPGVYIAGKLGVRIEDLLYIDENGVAKAFSRSNKSLIVL